MERCRSLGSIMRLRRLSYAKARRFRAEANGVVVAASPRLADITDQA